MITAFTEVLGFFFPEHHASGGAYTRPPGHANRTRPCSCPWSDTPHADTSVKPGNSHARSRGPSRVIRHGQGG